MPAPAFAQEPPPSRPATDLEADRIYLDVLNSTPYDEALEMLTDAGVPEAKARELLAYLADTSKNTVGVSRRFREHVPQCRRSILQSDWVGRRDQAAEGGRPRISGFDVEESPGNSRRAFANTDSKTAHEQWWYHGRRDRGAHSGWPAETSRRNLAFLRDSQTISAAPASGRQWVLMRRSGARRLSPFASKSGMSPLNVEAEVHDIAFLDDVFLAFEPQLAGIAGAGLALVLDVVVVARSLRRG